MMMDDDDNDNDNNDTYLYNNKYYNSWVVYRALQLLRVLTAILVYTSTVTLQFAL